MAYAEEIGWATPHVRTAVTANLRGNGIDNKALTEQNVHILQSIKILPVLGSFIVIVASMAITNDSTENRGEDQYRTGTATLIRRHLVIALPSEF